MLPAIQLHDQTSIRTDKIDDVLADFVLAPEFPALQMAVAQSAPKQLLGSGLRSPQTASSIDV